MDVHFVDTTFRDGSQSLWASGMRTGMMEVVAEIMDDVGFAAIEVPINGIYLKKFVRDLKEDPWDLLRMLGRKMPKTVKGSMAGGFILPFEPPPPRELIELFYSRVVATGAFNRAQLTSNTVDQIKRTFPWIIPIFRELGVQIVSGVLSREHVHMFVEIPPHIAVSDFVRRVKGRSSHRAQMEFPEIRKRYWGRHFWARGYFCTTSGNITDDMILQYLQGHEPTGVSR